MIKINVLFNNINWKKYIKNPQNFLDKKIALINKKNKLYKKKVLIFSILLSDSIEIKKLNKKFRNENKTTDIIYFNINKKKKLNNRMKIDKEIYLGDIIINIDKIKNKNKNIKFKEEFNKLWVHGLVHLFGYKHKKNRDFYYMNRIEKKYLKYIN